MFLFFRFLFLLLSTSTFAGGFYPEQVQALKAVHERENESEVKVEVFSQSLKKLVLVSVPDQLNEQDQDSLLRLFASFRKVTYRSDQVKSELLSGVAESDPTLPCNFEKLDSWRGDFYSDSARSEHMVKKGALYAASAGALYFSREVLSSRSIGAFLKLGGFCLAANHLYGSLNVGGYGEKLFLEASDKRDLIVKRLKKKLQKNLYVLYVGTPEDIAIIRETFERGKDGEFQEATGNAGQDDKYKKESIAELTVVTSNRTLRKSLSPRSESGSERLVTFGTEITCTSIVIATELGGELEEENGKEVIPSVEVEEGAVVIRRPTLQESEALPLDEATNEARIAQQREFRKQRKAQNQQVQQANLEKERSEAAFINSFDDGY